ncbi:MAG: hypothetical protein Q8Q28_11185 [Pseudomonadota bacterium]|nr:hypothetical protein [Pseudomonadota bacterium]
MAEWHSITEVIKRIARDTGETVTAQDIVGMAVQGQIRVGARIPKWEGPGEGELLWYFPDGSQVGSRSVSTDGIACWLNCAKLETLLVHDKVKLADIQWTPKEGGITLSAGSNSPFITLNDIRIPEPEYTRILAILCGEPLMPREPQDMTGKTEQRPYRREAEPGAALIQKWEEQAAYIFDLRETVASMPPSEQLAAKQLIEQCEKERRQLETSPEYLDARDGYLLRLKKSHEVRVRSGEQALIEQSASEIESWSGHLARLRIQAGEESPPSTGQWWETDYNILELAQDFGNSLVAEGRKPSQNSVTRMIEHHIRSKETRKTPPGGKLRVGFSITNLKKGPMKGWMYKPKKE